MTVGVVDCGGNTRALEPVEIRLPQGQWFDHQSKYMGNKPDTNQAEHAVEELCPSTLPPSTVQALQAHALAAHGVLGIVGYSRSDFIVTPAGPVYLETNTLPGLTRASLLPLALAHAGFALRDFVQLQMVGGSSNSPPE